MNSIKYLYSQKLNQRQKLIKIKASIKANNIEDVNKSGKKQWLPTGKEQSFLFAIRPMKRALSNRTIVA